MKRFKSPQAFVLVLLTLSVAGCGQQASEYEFHSGGNGAILWRCNRRTGEVDMTTAATKTWQRVAPQK